MLYPLSYRATANEDSRDSLQIVTNWVFYQIPAPESTGARYTDGDDAQSSLMAAGKVLPILKYCIGLVSCVAVYPWLESASGTPDQLIPISLVTILITLSAIDFIFQMTSRVYARSTPSLAMLAFLIAGYLLESDGYVVMASLLSVGLCSLGIFFNLLDRTRKGGPFLVFIFFLIPMFIGAILLTFPRCQDGDVALTTSESIFTSISAVTVTGLTVIDVGTRLSTEGHLILLALIQLGGLGTVSIFAFFALVLGNGLGIRQGRSLRESLDGLSASELKMLLGTICGMTLVLELVGSCLLFLAAGSQGSFIDHLFHSISAFCNAGFTLTSDSLASWNSSQKIVMAILIILGGIGFPVLHELLRNLRRKHSQRTSVQTRLILVVSSILLLGGAFVLFIFGAGVDSLFLSVTSRTAGFSTASTSAIPLPATVVLMVLMAIGASPGSTGGGLKTTTVGVLFLAAWTEMRSKQKVVVWKRTIRDAVIRTAAVLTLIASMIWLILTTLLLATESVALQMGTVDFLDLAFEVTSALGTVGLSRDVTTSLTEGGRWVIDVAMILGRLGPLALVIGIASMSPRVARGERPHGRVMLG